MSTLKAQQKPKEAKTKAHWRVIDSKSATGVRTLGGRREFYKDAYHSFLQASWRTVLGVFICAFLLINAAFACLYLLGGDCIANAQVGSFSDAFFFSVQTVATIGYGNMFPKTLYSNILVVCETLIGIGSLAMSTGLMFAKFSVPKARVLFSKAAIITRRDGQNALMFRMANERNNAIVEAQIKVVVLRPEVTVEGESMRRLIDLTLDRHHTPFFALSWVVAHYIDQKSPLFGMSQEQMLTDEIQVIVSFVGIDNTSGQTIHGRHSYTAKELLWNYRFVDVVLSDEKIGRYVDLNKFHDTEPARFLIEPI